VNARGLVALTGGTGFLGQHIVDRLQASGWRVRLLLRRPHAVADAETVIGALDDAGALDRLLDGADVLVHAAGLIKATGRDQFLQVNRDGSRRLAEAAARQAKPPRVVQISSLAAREPTLSDYAASKRLGEEAFAGLADRVVVRPTAVYGPGDRETALFFRAARGPLLPIPLAPQARVTMIHADDVADAVAALCPPGPQGQIFELTDSQVSGYSWHELARAMLTIAGNHARILELPAAVFRAIAVLSEGRARLTGKAAMLVSGKVRELFHPDWSSAQDRQPPSSLWRPKIDLHAGFVQTMNWLGSSSGNKY
jgi:2-alkyl-3-oxoalkanoate reductase